MQNQGQDINQLLGRRSQRQGDALGMQTGSINIASEAEDEVTEEEDEDDENPDAIEILERDYDPGQEDMVEDDESDEPDEDQQQQWQARQNQLTDARLRQR